jgi:hypothetical protein
MPTINHCTVIETPIAPL